MNYDTLYKRYIINKLINLIEIVYLSIRIKYNTY